MPWTYLQRIAREALAIEQEQARDAGALGYTARLLVQATMPQKDPGQDVSCFERSNGSFRLVMMAHPRVGLPWGKYPSPGLAPTWRSTPGGHDRPPRLVNLSFPKLARPSSRLSLTRPPLNDKNSSSSQRFSRPSPSSAATIPAPAQISASLREPLSQLPP